MKQLTNTERLEVAMSLLGEYEVGVYANICRKRELGCPDGLCEACLVVECAYPDPSDPQANGFHNVPAECENVECADCPFDPNAQVSRGCPYVD